jgi:hypothetical protein
MMRRHLCWIFLFALLLPLAQLAAAAHEVSHVRPALEMGSKSGLQGGHCDMCALAAQVDGGAAASSPPKLPLPAPRQSTPEWTVADRLCAGTIVPFDSRAPPNSLLP